MALGQWISPIAMTALALSWLFHPLQAAANDLPHLVIPEPFGVAIHQIDDRQLDAIAAAGFRIVRTDLRWDQVERSKGVYNWSRYLSLAGKLKRRGLRPLFMLAYSNQLYAPMVRSPASPSAVPAAPASKDAVDAFARWAAAAAKTFSDYDPMWEVWNEPEHDLFWPPNSDVDAYTHLAIQACESMRTQVPNAVIMGPAAAVVPNLKRPVAPFLEKFISLGALSCFNVVSVHPYLFVSDLDTTPGVWSLVRELIEKYAPSDSNRISVASTESGVSTFKQWTGRRVDEDTQAAYIIRMMLLNFAANVPVSIWYDWRDDGSDERDPQHRFGITTEDHRPKPALLAMTYLSKYLEGYAYKCRTRAFGNNAIALVLQKNGSTVIALWAKAGTGVTSIPLPHPTNIVRISSIDGRSIQVKDMLEMAPGHPFYLELRNSTLTDSTAYC